MNQASSDGPMFDAHGELIGIVSHAIARSGGSDGLGFVLTSNTAQWLPFAEPEPCIRQTHASEVDNLKGTETAASGLVADREPGLCSGGMNGMKMPWSFSMRSEPHNRVGEIQQPDGLIPRLDRHDLPVASQP